MMENIIKTNITTINAIANPLPLFPLLIPPAKHQIITTIINIKNAINKAAPNVLPLSRLDEAPKHHEGLPTANPAQNNNAKNTKINTRMASTLVDGSLLPI